MNRFVRLVKENVLPSIVFTAIAVSCGGAWYFFHPSSPYHARYQFVVAFDAVGTLSPGNRVSVRGIPCGQITKVELTEDAVYVTAQVLATTKISSNSEFRLINSGLMGERELNVLTEDSANLIADGDTLYGKYDEGTSGIGKKLTYILEGVGEIKDTLKTFADSLSGGSTGKRITRIGKKAKGLVREGKTTAASWKSEVQALLGECDKSLENAKQVLNDASKQGGASAAKIEALLNRTQTLLSKVDELKDEGNKIIEKLNQGDNTMGLFMDGNAPFNKKMDKLLVDMDNLLKDIKKNGVKLNVDIF